MKKPKTAAKTAGARKQAGTKAATKPTRTPQSGKVRQRHQNPAKGSKAATPATGGRVRKTRTDTKQAKLIAMLKAKDGATVEEIAKAFGWQTHTVRGALYGALKKKLGLDVISEKTEDRGRVYRIGS